MFQPTCCFSGYRPEKMPFPDAMNIRVPDALYEPLTQSILNAYHAGCTHFLTGMSRGFDLWAAQCVLHLRRELPLTLGCVIPFSGQEKDWQESWKTIYAAVLERADQSVILAPAYASGCFYTRNRYMADRASRLICFYDGQRGGTRYTVEYAQKTGLFIDNIANPQLTLL